MPFLAGDITYRYLMIALSELLPYVNRNVTFIDYVGEDVQDFNQWELVENIPVETKLHALRRFFDTNDEFDWAAAAAIDAYEGGISRSELAWALENCTKHWCDLDAGEEVFDLLFELSAA